MIDIKKKIKHVGIALWLKAKEKTYYAKNTKLKYLFFKSKGDALIISFSAYNDKPLYNYVRSLGNVKASRLYIKDDFGANHKGSYYLGEKAKHNVEKVVIELIYKIIKELNLPESVKLIFIGSSKGGYAALNFAVMFNNSYAIVGAPQYLLGTHLIHDKLYSIMDDIIGSRDENVVLALDNHIRKKYLTNPHDFMQHVYIQYSDAEYTYDLHIKHLIEDLRKTDIHTELETLHYKEHSEVHKYFPQYLQAKIKEILN